MTDEELRVAVTKEIEELLGWNLDQLFIDRLDRRRRFVGATDAPEWNTPFRDEATECIERLCRLLSK